MVGYSEAIHLSVSRPDLWPARVSHLIRDGTRPGWETGPVTGTLR
jgi:hypothetical protein